MLCWIGQLPVKKEGSAGRTGGRGGNAVAPSQSCPYEVKRERRQRCNPGRTAEVTKESKLSFQVSSIPLLFPEARLHTEVFLLSHNQEKKKSLTCSFSSRGICLACSGAKF